MERAQQFRQAQAKEGNKEDRISMYLKTEKDELFNGPLRTRELKCRAQLTFFRLSKGLANTLYKRLYLLI